MASTNRNLSVAGLVVVVPENNARRARRDRDNSGDPKPKPISVARLRRQRDADEVASIGEREYGVRVTG